MRRALSVVLLVTLAASLHPGVVFAAPANPRYAIAESPVGNEVLINWEPVSPTGASTPADVGYRVYRASSAAGPYSLIGTVSGQWCISFIDTGTTGSELGYLTRYWYRVASGDLTGWNSAPGVYMTGSPTGITAENLMSPTTGSPEAPRGLEATTSVTESTVNTVTLTWDAVAGHNISKYAVWRSNKSGDEGVLIGTTDETETPTFQDSTAGLWVESHYYYRVAAVATDGSIEATGAKSFELHVRPMSAVVIAVPHANPSPDGDSCLSCHDLHCAANDESLLAMETDDPDVFCLNCHDGTGSKYDILANFENTASESRHPVDAGTYTGGDLVCTDCHTPHGDPDAAGTYMLLSSHEQTGTVEYCLVCHKPDTPDDSTYSTRTYDMTAFRDSAHNGEGVADPPTGTQIKCRTCHLPHTSPNEDLLMYTGYRACFGCHSYADGGSLGSPDIYSRMTSNDDIDAHHDVLARDQAQSGAGRMSCQNCHNSHAATEGTPLIDPYDPAPWNPYPKSVSAAFSSITSHWENSFCFECHDNSLPASTDTSPWVAAPFWSDPSGDGTSTSDFDNITTRWTSQNHGTRSTSNENLWDDISTSPSTYNPEMHCVDCHDPHGTLGVRNLRSDLEGRHGLVVVQLDDVTGGSGYDSRFWCMGCHEDASSTHSTGGKTWGTFPKDCSRGGSCHGHQNGGGQF